MLYMNTIVPSMRSTHSNTRSSKNLDEENRKKAVRRTNCKDVAQDVAGIVLSTLEQAATFAPVPYLQQAAGLAIGLIDMVQSTSDNKAAFKSLATDACGLVYAAANVWKDQDEKKDGKKIPRDLARHLEEMLETMRDIMKFAEMRAARGYLARFVSHKADSDKIQSYRVQLKEALDRFGMQSHITVRDAVARIQDQQDAILDAIKDRASTTEEDTSGSPHTASVRRSPPSPSSKKVEPGHQVTLTSQVPRTSPPSPASFTAFANITNNGSGTFNSINGDYVIDNSMTNNSSTNSGNITNVSTVNSNNTYSTGRNGWANRWGRNGVGDNVGLTKGQAMGMPVRSSGRRGRRLAA
ncbi:Fungal N-terminal domain-containing protein [Pleurotus pulmonarius]